MFAPYSHASPSLTSTHESISDAAPHPQSFHFGTRQDNDRLPTYLRSDSRGAPSCSARSSSSRPMQLCCFSPSVSFGFFQSFGIVHLLSLIDEAAPPPLKALILTRPRAGVLLKPHKMPVSMEGGDKLSLSPPSDSANHQISEPHWLTSTPSGQRSRRSAEHRSAGGNR